jgi:hypothetical protein
VSIEYVSLIENFLSTELGVGFDETALLASGNLSSDQLDFFSSQLSAVDTALHNRMVQVESGAAILRPDAVSDRPWTDDDDIRPFSAMFTHPYNGLARPAVDHVKRQVLFFSRVAIVAPEHKHGTTLAEKRTNFSAYLESIIELKPSVDDRSVVLLPRRGFYSNEIEGGASLVRRACTEDIAIQKWIDDNPAMLAEFASGARRNDPYFDAGIRICSALTYGHALAATHPFVGHLHKMLLSDKRPAAREMIAATRNLDKVDLPGLSGLNWKDVLAVRRDEESLRRWRADLTAAITNVDPNLPPDEFVYRFDSQVQAQLRRAALELDADLKKSSPMKRFNRGVTGLMISGAAATARLALGGPLAVWDAIREVAQKEGAKEAVRFFWESREAAAKRALRSHYAVFSQPD